MTHVVFQHSDINVLKEAITLDETLAGDVVEIKDDFAVGPLHDIYETAGYQQRRDWWKDVLQFSPYADATEITDDKLAVHTLIKKLEDGERQLWIWVAQNAHDVCGYYWLVSQLKNYAGNIYILHLHNLPFINEKGSIFYPTALHEIQPKEFLKAKKLARPVTTSEFEVDADEWKKTCDENALVRRLEGGKKIVGKEVNYFDKELLKNITTEPQKLQKILHQFFSKTKETTGDAFLVWRLRKSAEENIINISGEWGKGWKDITVKLSLSAPDVL